MTVRRSYAVCLLVAGLVQSTLGQSKTQLINTAATTPPIIPRDVLFGNPDKASLRLSPDGKRFSYLAPVDGVLNVWEGPSDRMASMRAVTHDKHRGIRAYFWAYTSKHILYIQDKDGDENWHVYCVDLISKETIDLTPFENVSARVQHVSEKFPDEILVSTNDRNPQLHDIRRVNITTGKGSVILENEGYVGFVTDEDYTVRFGLKMTPDGGSELFKANPVGDWTSFSKIPAADSLTTNPIALDQSGENLYMLDSRGRNTAAFTIVNIQSGATNVLAEDPQADISNVIFHPTQKHIQAVASTYERRKWHILDKSIEADFEVLEKVADGDFNIISRTLADDVWIVAYVVDDGPVRYYNYNRKRKRASFLFSNRAALDKVKLAKMHPVIIKARDGLKLVSYLTLPIESDPDGDGRPNKALPMVLFVHGGPWARDRWGYNTWHQWLANRGYAVLSVNYRGSTGFGKNFINAANMEWAGKMHDDLLDAVDWAVAEKIADKDRVGIMGGSYGGYATLVGLTFTPDKFACGVDIVGPSSLVTLLNSIPPYWAPMIDLFTTRVGDHRTEEGRKFLTERSPLTFVDRIRKPLLIGQGANDPRVKQAESDQIVKAMQAKGIPVTYALFPDEGHGFRRPENSMSFNAIAEVFLSKHLGGRFEEMSDDIAASSMDVPAGPEQIPGLKELLERIGRGVSDPS